MVSAYKPEGLIPNPNHLASYRALLELYIELEYPGRQNAAQLTPGHFGKYHNTLCLSPQILHEHCFCFLLGPLKVPRETENNAYAKFGGTDKDYYGIFQSGLCGIKCCVTALPHIRDACLFFLKITGFFFFLTKY